MKNVMDSSGRKREEWFNFLWNRTRAIRKVEIVSKGSKLMPRLAGWFWSSFIDLNTSGLPARVFFDLKLALSIESGKY